MKKSVLILLTFVPILVGYLIDHTLHLPVIGWILYLVLPLLVTVFWFFLGRMYARSSWSAPAALLIGNGTGLVSLGVFLWQMLLETDETRNLALTVASQMFPVAVPTYLFGRLPSLFETQPNFAGLRTHIAIHVIGTLFMVLVFALGYGLGRRSRFR